MRTRRGRTRWPWDRTLSGPRSIHSAHGARSLRVPGRRAWRTARVCAPERLERRELLTTIGDLVWHDTNADGLQQPDEPGVSGAVVELIDGSGQSRGTRVTGADGQYQFTGLEPGNYRLHVRAPVGFQLTPRDIGGDDALDSDVEPLTGLSNQFALAAEDATRDAGLQGAAPDFGFALAGGGSGVDRAEAVAVDEAGNVYVTGTFAGDANFASGAVPRTLTSAGDQDIFVAKYSPTGALVWVRSMGGLGATGRGRSIVVDAQGGVFVAGDFTGTVDFDPTPTGTRQLAASETNVFVARLDAAGRLDWVRRAGAGDGVSIGSAEGLALDVADSGAVFVTGQFAGQVDFDPGVGQNILDAGDSSDAFFWKLSGTGELEWVRSAQGTNVAGTGVAVGSDGSLFAAGHFAGTVQLDSVELQGENSGDIFVSRLDSSGEVLWASRLGGDGADIVGGLALDPWDNPILAGHFEQTVDFAPGDETFPLTAVANQDAFVLKLNRDGGFRWVRGYAGQGTVSATGLAIDGNGNIYATGRFESSVDFDPDTGSDVLSAQGGGDAFLSKLDAFGNHVLARAVGGFGIEQATGIAVDGAGRPSIAGWFATLPGQPADFDPGPDEFPLAGDGSDDFFLASLQATLPSNSSPVLQPEEIVRSTDEDTGVTVPLAELFNGGPGTISMADADALDPLGGIALEGTSGRGGFFYSLDGTTFLPVGAVDSSAALLLPPEAHLRYVPDGANGETAQWNFRGWDGSAGAAGTKWNVGDGGGGSAFSTLSAALTVQVADVNDAPTLLPVAPSLETDEDTPRGFAIEALSNGLVGATGLSDADQGDPVGGLAVTEFSGLGTLYYSLDGVAFDEVGFVSEAQALLLPPAARLRYVPHPLHGQDAVISYRAWDQTAGAAGERGDTTLAGGTTPFSEQQDTLTILVTDVNDAPQLLAGNPRRTTSEDAPAVVSLPSFINSATDETFIFDVDPGATIGGIAVVATEGRGVWEYAIESMVFEPIGGVSDAAALLLPPSATLRYTPDAANGETARLRFRAWDATQGAAGDKRSAVVTGGTAPFSDGLDTLWINVSDVNDAPIGIALDNLTVPENRVAAAVGRVSVADPDEDDTHALAVSDDRFEIVGGILQLKPGQALDHEANDKISLTITATDAGQSTYSETFLIEVLDANEPPTGVLLEGAAIEENAPGGVVGSLLAEDPDEGDQHTFKVADGRFEVTAGQLRLKPGVALDHEAEDTVEVDVTVTDDGQPARQATHRVTIEVVDVNEPPERAGALADQTGMSNIPLSFSVPEGTFVDVDEGDELAYSAASADGGDLPGWLAFDPSTRTFHGEPSIYDPGPYPLRVTVTDQGNLTADGTFLLQVQPAPAPWQNPANPLDVNRDGRITPVDILILINYINNHPGNPALPSAPAAPPPFYDVNGDNLITPSDILVIINFANGGGAAEGESGAAPGLAALVPATPVPVLPLSISNSRLADAGGLPDTTCLPAPSPVRPAVFARGLDRGGDLVGSRHHAIASPDSLLATGARRHAWTELTAETEADWWLESELPF